MKKVWVIYDITKNNVREKIAQICLDKGLYRVQKSVFLGIMNHNEWDSLALEFESLINKKEDSVYILPMDNESFNKIRLLGQAFDEKLVTGKLLTKII